MFQKSLKAIKRIIRRMAKSILSKKNMIMRPDGASRQGLLDLISYLNASHSLTMAEIGSYKGESAEIFLSTGKVSKIYCVDPWKQYYDDDDGAAFTDMVKVEADFDARHGGDSRVVKVKGTIETLVELISNTGVRLDVVYVDGCHTYEAVKHDIKVAMECLKPSMAIAGHDYAVGSSMWEGVVRAIEETIGKPSATFSDTSWVKMLCK